MISKIYHPQLAGMPVYVLCSACKIKTVQYPLKNGNAMCWCGTENQPQPQPAHLVGGEAVTG